MFLATERPEVHGWAIVRATGRAGPVVYNMLARLSGWGWLTARWEDPRRYYRLTAVGQEQARALLAARRGWPPVSS